MLSRQRDGSWVQIQHDGLDARVELAAINAALALADVFEGLDFAATPQGPAVA